MLVCSLLDRTMDEIPWDVNSFISKLSPTLLYDEVAKITDILGIKTKRCPTLKQNARLFLDCVIYAHDKLGLFKCGLQIECNRNRTVDKDRWLLTCSNLCCVKCTF